MIFHQKCSLLCNKNKILKHKTNKTALTKLTKSNSRNNTFSSDKYKYLYNLNKIFLFNKIDLIMTNNPKNQIIMIILITIKQNTKFNILTLFKHANKHLKY